MSTAITTINTQDMMSIAKAFAESGMFTDCKSVAQAVVKIQAGKEFGIQPFASMSGIHIIQGKPTIGAGLMAARVKGFGKYDYRVIEHTELKCSIDFMTKDKEFLGNSTFTIEDARRAGTKNLEKFPKNMLFARAMSNGVKWYTPDIYETPVYVPEEMEDLQPTVDAVATEVETPQEKEKPFFTEDKFALAKANNATFEMIERKYQLTDDIKQKYIDYATAD